MIGIGVLGFIATVAAGSRAAVSFPLMGAILIIRHEISQRRLHPLMIASTSILLAMSVITFSVTLLARSIPHGILNFPNVVEVTISDSLASTDSFLLPLKQLTSSVFVSVPDTEMSATYGVDLDVLIANANVLPGTAQATELERYWPYEWVPLSFAGSWFVQPGGSAISCCSAPLVGYVDIPPTIFSAVAIESFHLLPSTSPRWSPCFPPNTRRATFGELSHRNRSLHCFILGSSSSRKANSRQS